MNDNDSRTTTSLFSSLVNNLTSLIRQEVLLAKTEINTKISQISTGGVSLAVGGAVIFAGFLVLLLSAVLGLSYFLPPWLSALIIGSLVTIIGIGLVSKGRKNIKASNLKPEQTIASMRRNIDFTKEQFGRASQ